MGQSATPRYLGVRRQQSAGRLRPQGAHKTGETKMQTEGIRKTALSLIIVLATSLSLCRPLSAQRLTITNLPHLVPGEESPVSFMRPHYTLNPIDPGAT